MDIQEPTPALLLKRLSKAVIEQNLLEQAKVRAEIFAKSASVIPELRSTLESSIKGSIKRKEQLQILVTVACLLYEIDDREAIPFFESIIGQGCPDLLRVKLESLMSYSLDFNQYVIRGVRIFEKRNIGTTIFIPKLLENWLHIVPDEDLQGIKRLNISPTQDVFADIYGLYTYSSCQIYLVWYNPFSSINPFFWLALKRIQKTFYHEIGHHAKGHHPQGDLLIQEREAEDYAISRLHQYHPTIASLFVGKRWFNSACSLIYRRIKSKNAV
jgi:hypothetical protein